METFPVNRVVWVPGKKPGAKWRKRSGQQVRYRNITNMVAEPDSESRPEVTWVKERIETLEQKVVNMERLLDENFGRSVLTNIRVNRLREQLGREQKDPVTTPSEQVKDEANDEDVNLKAVRRASLHPEAIVSELVNIESQNVKAIIGPRGDRINKIRETTGVKRVDLNGDVKTFTVIGTAEQIQAARILMKDIAAGRLEGVQETSVTIQVSTSRCRDIIGPQGKTVKKIQEPGHISSFETLSFKVFRKPLCQDPSMVLTTQCLASSKWPSEAQARSVTMQFYLFI
jgi:transcription antitermination factor NusA-like protein